MSQHNHSNSIESESASDETTYLMDLRRLVAEFVSERDWHQFHQPKNLAMSIAIEAAELMEHFQWLTHEETTIFLQDESRRQAVGDEMADVLCYLLAMANRLNIDLSSAVINKMRKNREKYPADQIRGRYDSTDPFRSA